GAAKRAAFRAVVTVAVTHHQRTEIGVTKTESAENVRILRDLLDRVTGIIDHDFLRGDEDADRGLESLDVELAVCGLKLQQIQRRQIAGGIVEKEIFAARVCGILPASSFAGVPFMNRG